MLSLSRLLHRDRCIFVEDAKGLKKGVEGSHFALEVETVGGGGGSFADLGICVSVDIEIEGVYFEE